MKRILSLTDFSELAETGVVTAFELAKEAVIIYHKLEKDALMSLSLEQSQRLDFLNTPSQADCFERWKVLAKEKATKAQAIFSADDLLSKVGEIVEQLDIDLIVMGSTGAGGKEAYIWGSNTERVVQSVHCPVLVVKGPMQDFRLDSIVFASSFDQQEKDVLEYALKLIQPEADAMIHLLSIDTSSYFAQTTQVMQAAMKDFVEVAKPWATKRHFYKDASIDSGIRNFMEEVKPDLLIMSNKFNKPLKYAFTGNQAIRMVNHSDFPVLTIDYKD